MADQRSAAEELRRRKVRKGTHSCWECRRRKIRCQYSAGNDSTCLPCQARGSVCRSQEFIDETRAQPGPDRRMAQRLGRLEDMMARLVDRIMPDNKADSGEAASPARPRHGSLTPSNSEDEGAMAQAAECLGSTFVDDTPVGLLLGLRSMQPRTGSPSDALTPESCPTSTAPSGKPNPAKYEKVCKTLHALFPCQQDIDIVVKDTPGAFFIVSQFFTFREVLAGKSEPPNRFAVIPPVTAHPSLMAKRLLGLCICMQQLPPTFDIQQLRIKNSIPRTMNTIVTAVSDLVTSNDELVATAEGLQSLVMQGLWQSNSGNLRKAWLNYRRALSFGQLIGIDRGNTQALRYVDAETEVSERVLPERLWYRIVAHDRNLSMLLGLPVGTTDDDFASEEAMRDHTSMEKLEKMHTVVAAKLVERNNNKTPEAYALTQAIDCDLEVTARSMGAEWWEEPKVTMQGDTQTMGDIVHLLLQVAHYDLLVMLHLPYMLRDPNDSRYDYSKATCTRASREVLKRFITFRNLISGANSCRHLDYSGLIAAMTLLISYLRQNPAQAFPSCAQRAEDRKLVEIVRERMQHVAVLNGDKLSQESADIIGQLMPIMDSIDAAVTGVVSECPTEALKCFQLTIPYFGTINIHPNAGDRSSGQDQGAPGTLPTAPLNIYNLNVMPTAASQSSGDGQSTAERVATLPNAMELTSLDPSLTSPAANGMFMELDLEPQTQTEMFNFPGLTAEAEDWTFQGVDTAYWSLLNNTNLGEHS